MCNEIIKNLVLSRVLLDDHTTPHSLFLKIRGGGRLLLLAPAGGSNTEGLYPSPFPSPVRGISNIYLSKPN